MDQRQLPSPTEGPSPSRLTALPSELRAEIFSHLRPDPETWGTNGRYTDLVSLYKTHCHSIAPIALRTLYDTVVVRSAAQMTQVLYILSKYRQRRLWIRTFHCLESLSNKNSEASSKLRPVLPGLASLARCCLLRLLGPTIHDGDKLAAIYGELKVRQLNDRETSEFRQRLYYTLLCLMPVLRNLVFPTDDIPAIGPMGFLTESQLDKTMLMAVVQEAPHAILASLLQQSSTEESESHGMLLLPCPEVKSLKFRSVQGFWTSYQATTLLHFPQPKTITLEFHGQVWRKEFFWRVGEHEFPDAPPDAASIFAAVKHLRVFPDMLELDVMSSLAEVVKYATQMETLEIGGAQPGIPLRPYDSRRARSLNRHILRELAPTLRRLAVYQKWATLADSLLLFGHRQRLARLVRLTKLEELLAPSFAIFGPLFMEKREAGSWLHWAPIYLPMPDSFNRQRPGASENVPDYADPTNSGDPENPDKLVHVARTTKLPPALKLLEIYEDPCSDFRWTEIPSIKRRARRTALFPRSSGKLFRFIKEFSFDFRNRFPRMERVVFWAHDWQGETPQWTDEEVQEVKDSFSAEGVQFVYKDYPDHAFGDPRALFPGNTILERPNF